MPIIKEEIWLNCSPERAFNEISDLDFAKKINPNSGLNNQIIFQNERIIRYLLKVANVGEWESERVIIPETHTIITQRRNPLAPFKFMVVLHIFKANQKGTLFTYIEEFELFPENKAQENRIISDIMRKVGPNLNNIKEFFNNEL